MPTATDFDHKLNGAGADARHLADQQAAMATPGDPSEPRTVIHHEDPVVVGSNAFWRRHGLEIGLAAVVVLQGVALAAAVATNPRGFTSPIRLR